MAERTDLDDLDFVEKATKETGLATPYNLKVLRIIARVRELEAQFDKGVHWVRHEFFIEAQNELAKLRQERDAEDAVIGIAEAIKLVCSECAKGDEPTLNRNWLDYPNEIKHAVLAHAVPIGKIFFCPARNLHLLAHRQKQEVPSG